MTTATALSDFAKRLDQTAEDTEALLGTGFVNSDRRVCCALKLLEKAGSFSEICRLLIRPRALRRAFSG